MRSKEIRKSMRIVFALLTAAVLFLPVTAQAQACYGNFCDWIAEDFANLSNWSSYAVSIETYNDSCHGGLSNDVAELQTSSTMSTSFYVDGNVSSGTQFEVDFRLTILYDIDNWYDVITVRVTNDDTNTTETFYVRASDYDSDCYDIAPLVLSNDYRNHNVTVEFEVGYLTQCTFQIDDVSFWQY